METSAVQLQAPLVTESMIDLPPPSRSDVGTSYFGINLSQVKLMMWKRNLELTNQKYEIYFYTLPPLMGVLLLVLLYNSFEVFPSGTFEAYIVPISTWVFSVKVIVAIVHEKSSKLHESMKMMGLHETSYWLSYFLYDGILIGGILSFLSGLLSLAHVFDGNVFNVFFFYLLYCMSMVTFVFFISVFFDTPASASQGILAINIAFYVVYVACYNDMMDSEGLQSFLCLFPPLAFQLACGSFQSGYDGISLSTINGIAFSNIFQYAALAWYFSQVWPNEFGVQQPFYFIFLKTYWFPTGFQASKTIEDSEVEATWGERTSTTDLDEAHFGSPTVCVANLVKRFGEQVAVNNLSFDMYENQIFCLLGHNGAGKTTTINMLTGLLPPSSSLSGKTSIYGSDIASGMNDIRQLMGVCPQHDVLFDNLTVKEHIIFFSSLKGSTAKEAEVEARKLTKFFHLENRLKHLGSELSGGQQRKLSVAIAISGGSKFIVLDEPTAGMDPLARRELWDLLASLRKGRTMLLTTHYMDEADILGDRVAIMSLGKLECIGTTQHLKRKFGSGYKLIIDPFVTVMGAQTTDSSNFKELDALTKYVTNGVPESTLLEKDANLDEQIIYVLPFDKISYFGDFFLALSRDLTRLGVASFGVALPSMEDVFLKVGADHTVKPELTKTLSTDIRRESFQIGIGGERKHEANFMSQVIGMMHRRFKYCSNDFTTVPLLGLPLASIIAVAVLSGAGILDYMSTIALDCIYIMMYMGAYIAVPGFLAEFIVRERECRLRNVLNVSGCDPLAYLAGNFMADYIILLIPTIIMFISWGAADMTDFSYGKYSAGLSFWVILFFNAHLISFSYMCSNIFSKPKSCMAFMPMFVLFLIFLPNIIIMLIAYVVDKGFNGNFPFDQVGGVIIYGITLFSPQGALISGLLISAADTNGDISDNISYFPPVYATILFMIGETILYLYVCLWIDRISTQAIPRLQPEEDFTFDQSVLDNLDTDVVEERKRTQELISNAGVWQANEFNKEHQLEAGKGRPLPPLVIDRLRKVFPPTKEGQKAVVATQDSCFCVDSGEIFGLLGANGAGKTTLLSMLTRHLVPTCGDAQIAGNSVLSSFNLAATHLGVVTQTNSLWDKLSVEDHLYLFARIRGVDEKHVKGLVDATIDQLELRPHKHKLSMKLSGGMKRKLCVAIALIGDPEVVLLDEPSAGLDPVSRRNLWNVILRTMSERAVVLTTHSMEEAEALCRRIGIMVKGQLRALGTKQQLKSKFGVGFEVAVKLIPTKNLDMIARNKEQLGQFITTLFKTGNLISDNGGLMTYKIDREEMSIGKIFKELEANKSKLSIEDYSVSQPTLEQVFISTVENHEKLAARDQVVMEVEMDIVEETNKCGCTKSFLWKYIIGGGLGAWLLFFIIGMIARQPNLFAFGSIFFMVGIFGCFSRYCPCLQKPHDLDE